MGPDCSAILFKQENHLFEALLSRNRHSFDWPTDSKEDNLTKLNIFLPERKLCVMAHHDDVWRVPFNHAMVLSGCNQLLLFLRLHPHHFQWVWLQQRWKWLLCPHFNHHYFFGVSDKDERGKFVKQLFVTKWVFDSGEKMAESLDDANGWCSHNVAHWERQGHHSDELFAI